MSAMARLVPLVAVLGIVAACGGGGGEDAGGGATPMGRSFVSTKVEGTPIPGGGPLRLSFADGRVSATSGCNTGSGPVSFDGDVLRVSGMATTLMACPDDRSGADAWQTALLQSGPKWRLTDDTLTLTGDDITVTLLDKKVAEPDRTLTGTAWTVTALLRPEGQVRSRALDDARPSLTIAPDGQVTGTAGCNRMTGGADIAGADVTFRIATTKVACPPEAMEVERQVLEALDGTATATIDADTLTLRNAGNNTGLVLRAQ
ncbi:META domain-containing protein [Nocardia blacklockiae]|uniref:META domain-containing protein n=1 Tax=Nocardia blacklockiae TaxID=480036 RepID=UPI00189482BF|nr:META domain-containing protein [Nocardia blacklockiae]MBF6176709.1 META domain-containing protein [Nocardia blacklockiae]